MFNKLLSNLPFNPSLINQVAFYGKRLKKETSVRRIGFLFIAATMALQVFAVVAPPKQSSANPGNDLIPNGFSSPATAVNYCRSNIQGFGDIMSYYDISCDDIARGTTVTIRSTDYNNQLYSMGRIPYGIANEYSVPINGSTYYMRSLWGWDNGRRGPPPASTYKAIQFTSGGKTFFILYDCGNLATIGKIIPPVVTPYCKLSISGTNATGYKVTWRNYNVFGTSLDAHLKNSATGNEDAIGYSATGSRPVSPRLGYDNKYTYTVWNAGKPTSISCSAVVNPDKPPTTGEIEKRVNGKKEAKLRVGERFTYTVTVKNTGAVDMKTVGVKDQAPKGIEFIPNGGTIKKDVFETTIPVLAKGASKEFSIPAKITRFVAGKTANEACFITSGAGDCDVAYTYTEEPCQYNPNIPNSNPACVPCEGFPADQAGKCLVLSKTARNVTQNIANADGTVANPNDIIEYKLNVKNTSKATIKKFVIQENISDLLEYARVIDFHGGTANASGIVAWPAKDIAAGQTLTQVLTIKIKDPIPENPQSAANPGSYDHTLTNVYGDTVINIKVPVPPTVTVTTSLPNTGPGTSLVVGFTIASMVGYFFARSKLLSREINIVKQEYTSIAGGA